MKYTGKIAVLLICLLAPMLFVGSAYENTGKESASDNRFNLLVCGKDSTSGLDDTIMLISVDETQNSVVFLQIPRDTYVDFGGDGYKKINGASQKLGGYKALCRELSDSVGVKIDGYVAFDSEFVKKAIDAIGGVEVNVPCNMDYDDPYQDLSIHLKKGMQTLDGKSAVGFVRYRSGYLRADIGRMDAQKIFIASLARSFAKKAKGLKLLSLASLSLRYIKTDVPINKLLATYNVLKDSSFEKMSFATMPGEEVRSKQSGAWFYILSKSGCRELVEKIGGVGFDEAHIYSDKSREEFEEIYNREIKARVYTAEEIDSKGIEIIPK